MRTAPVRSTGAPVTLLWIVREPTLREAVDACSALVLGSNTLIGARERSISVRARELALTLGKPLIVDVNLRLTRWPDLESATEAVRGLCRDALLVKASAQEALFITGESDPVKAATAICSQLGAGICAVTLGPAGAIVAGEVSAKAAGVRAKVVDTTGAGDALTGVLVAALAGAGFAPQAVSSALSLAIEVAARSTESYGATEALPDKIDLQALISGTPG